MRIFTAAPPYVKVLDIIRDELDKLARERDARVALEVATKALALIRKERER